MVPYRPVSGPEVDHLQSEIEALREELEKTQREKNKKDTLIRSLKDVRYLTAKFCFTIYLESIFIFIHLILCILILRFLNAFLF